jgi:membrane dipeptidase
LQIDEWYKRGVRIFGCVQAGHNDWADSSRPNKKLGDGAGEHGGLSELGKQGVARLNQLGVLIEVSQLGVPAGFEPDEGSGGGNSLRHQVVQIVAFSNYLRPAPPATVAQLVDALDYAVKKIGIDHVGISSDFNHGAFGARPGKPRNARLRTRPQVKRISAGESSDALDSKAVSWLFPVPRAGFRTNLYPRG